jgi:hypothetical protein
MDKVRKDASCLWVSQWARCVLWLVLRQKTVVQERVVTSDAKLAGVLKVYATDDIELLAGDHCVLSVSIFLINHLPVRLDIPVIVVFVFDRGFVKDLRWADMVAASESTEKKSW